MRRLVKIEVVKLKPIKDKEIILYLIATESIIGSKNEIMNITNILNKFNLNFVTINLKDENSTKKAYANLLELTKKYIKPFFLLDIPKNVKKEFMKEISRHNEQIEELELEYKVFNCNNIEKGLLKSQDFKSWIDYLKNEVKETENHFNFKLRPYWIVKGLLDLIEMYNEKNMYIMHFTPKEILPELRTICEDLGITIVTYNINRDLLHFNKYLSEQLINFMNILT